MQNEYASSQCLTYSSSKYAIIHIHVPPYTFEDDLLPSGVSIASEARPIIAFYSRFRDICIYIYIYTNIYVSVGSRNRRLAHMAIVGKWRP